MKKALPIPLLALLLVACLLLPACKTANKPSSTTTTSATTTTAATTPPITAPLPTEERYTDEMGRYVCKNVATLAKLEQYFVPYNARSITDSMGDDKICCMIREKDYQESTVAVVKKIASESYFTAYEDQRTPLAYTYSTLEIVSLPAGGLNYHNLQVGDTVIVVEPYAFSPDSPNVIYRSHIFPRFSLQWGIMEFGSEYLVNITSLPSAIQCNETGKETSETLELPDDCYFLGADLYPVDRKVYDAWMSEAQTAGDLAIPSAYPEWASEWWTIIYQWAYEEYVSN